MIPPSNLVHIEASGGPQTLARYNRVRALTLEANLAEGYLLGEALAYLERIVQEELPEEATIDYKGQSRDYINAGSSILFVFALGLTVVFLVLSAQFESFIHPLVIMLTVPATIGGGLTRTPPHRQLTQHLLTDRTHHARRARREKRNPHRRIRQPTPRRRPPLQRSPPTRLRSPPAPHPHDRSDHRCRQHPAHPATGAGSETRIVIGVVVLFGVVAATLLTLFIVPVAYHRLARYTGSPKAISERLETESQPHPHQS